MEKVRYKTVRDTARCGALVHAVPSLGRQYGWTQSAPLNQSQVVVAMTNPPFIHIAPGKKFRTRTPLSMRRYRHSPVRHSGISFTI